MYSLLTKTAHIPFEHFSIENLTNNGHVSLATISPDGKYLLDVHDENGMQSLWLRHIQTGSNTQVIAPAATRYSSLMFSPDASYIYFVRRDEAEHTISILYSAPVLGGTPKRTDQGCGQPDFVFAGREEVGVSARAARHAEFRFADGECGWDAGPRRYSRTRHC